MPPSGSRKSGPSGKQIAKAIEAFINAQTWEESKHIVEAKRDKLLTDTVDQLLANLIEQSKSDTETTLLLEEHRDLLKRCRRDGIEAAFADLLYQDELQTLLDEINNLNAPSDMSRRTNLCRAALSLVDGNTHPKLWADLLSNLADSLRRNPLGERADNVEEAIYYYEQALKVRTHKAFPEQWAMTQNNLATAYDQRIRGERADNLEQAIHYYEQALEVYTHQGFPEQWAMTQHNLAVAYRERIRGERADNLEQAIHYYEQALKIHTHQSFPEQWAMTQNNLGLTYAQRIRGERTDNLEQAIHYYEQALEVYTHQGFPEQWAMTQHNLGSAYLFRIRGERTDNLEQAIHHYQQALEVRTPMAFPQDCRDTAYLFGSLLYDEGRFSKARYALETAHQAVETLRGEVQRDVAKHALSEENADLYARLVSCCLKEGDEPAAFAYIVAGKGRAFVDLLATVRFDLSAASANNPALADDLRRVRELRQQIDNLLATLTGESGSFMSGSSGNTPLPPGELRAQMSALQAQAASHWEEMAYKYPALTATQKTPTFSADQARSLAAELDATLVEYYQHIEGWCAFVVTPNAVHYVPLPLIEDNSLESMVRWMLRIEKPEGLNRLSYTRLSKWHDAVIAPLQAYLPQEQPIVLAPFGILHVLPLATARHPLTGRYVAEDHQIAFAPSLAALSTAWNQVHRTGKDEQAVPRRLLSVAYPGTPNSKLYLPDVLPEAKAIAGHFAQVTPLHEEKATPDAVVAHSHGQDVVHFGCHGWFDAEQPEQSGLLLAGGWLTVQRIITELRLEQARLATLGACLSGRAAIQSGDEHVGLLQAMLSTGVQAVVASLWSVDDAATRAFFEAFYAHLAAGRSPARALQEAAQFVRERPGWAHPYYWAAFQVSGLAYGAQEPVPAPMPTHLEGHVDRVQQSSTRGERPMNTEQSIEGALDLLEQMSEDPNEVLGGLDKTQQAAVMRDLDVLAERAANVQSDADLLGVVDAIHRLVEDQPGLRSLLLPEGTDVATERSQRTVTMADHLAATGQNTYAQERAPQMRNAVIEARAQLEAVLKRTEKPKHKHDGEKSDDFTDE